MLDNLSNVEFIRFCSLPNDEYEDMLHTCPRPAVGELSVEFEDRTTYYAVCAKHLADLTESK